MHWCRRHHRRIRSASLFDASGRLVSRSQSSGLSPSVRAGPWTCARFRTRALPQKPLLFGGVSPIATSAVRRQSRPSRLPRVLAPGSPARRTASDMDLEMFVHGLTLHRLEAFRSIAAEHPIVLCPHQQIDHAGGGVSRWTPRRPCPRDRPRAPQEPNSSHTRCPSATRRAKLSADIRPFPCVSSAAMKSIARMPLHWHMPHGMHTVSAGVWQRLVWYRKPPGCRIRHMGSGASPLTERFSRPCGGFPPIVLAVAGFCSRPGLRRSRAATESSGMAETE